MSATILRLVVPEQNTDRILKEVGEERPDTLVVLCWNNDGNFVFKSSTPNGAEVLWLLETAKTLLLQEAHTG